MIEFTYNGKSSLSNFGIVAKSVKRPLLPVLKKRELSVPGRHGIYDFGSNTFENRIINVLLQFTGTNVNNMRLQARNIAAWLSSSLYTALIFDDEPDKYYLARVYDDVDLDTFVRAGEAKVTFECQPFAYAAATQYNQTYQYDTGRQYDSGLIYPNPTSFNWIYDRQSIGFYHYGNQKTPVKITITGAFTSASVTHEETGAYLRIGITSGAGQILVIDSDNSTVTLNGANVLDKVSGSLDSFIVFNPGDNGLVFEGGSANATVAVEWLQRFL